MSPTPGRPRLNIERHTVSLLKSDADNLRRINSNLSQAIRRILQEPILAHFWCQHERLELRGHLRPADVPAEQLWISDPGLVCLACGTHMLNRPRDLARIVNIPHPPPDECQHPNATRVFPLSGFGAWCCLQCGYGGIAEPTYKLHVSTDAVIWPDCTTPGTSLSIDKFGSFGIGRNS